MAIRIHENNIGVILTQAGIGVPTHISPKSTVFFDLSTAVAYINKNDAAEWAYFLDSSMTSGSTSGGSGTNILITGGTPNNAGHLYTFTNSTGGTFNVLGLPDVYVTSGVGNEAGHLYTFTNNTGGTFNMLGLNDIRVTGGTYSNGTILFTNNTGGTFNVTGFFTGSTDVFTTGGTPNNTGLLYTFTNNTGGTFNVLGLNDVRVTGGTYTAGTATFTNNTGGTFSVTGFTYNPDATIDFSVNANPNLSGTTFSPNITGSTLYVYVSTIDNSQWTYNGSVYVIASSPFWSKNGNTATTANFIGTTNNVALNFRVNNQPSGQIEAVFQNTSFGYQALMTSTAGTLNTAVGFRALGLLRNTGGNTAIGTFSLYNNLQNYNTGVGDYTLFNNTTGFRNVAIGHRALYNNITGSHNTVVGCYDVSGDQLMTTGARNTSLGYNTMKFTNGDDNTAIGLGALGGAIIAVHTASRNTIIGKESFFNIQSSSNDNSSLGMNAGYSTTSGASNTFLGTESGHSNLTGSSNVFVGYYSGYYSISGSSQIILNSLNRTSFAGDVTESPIYIQQHATINSQLIRINGKVGIKTSPTAFLHLPASTTSASTAPLKFTTSGSLLTTPEQGAMEWDGNRLYIGDSAPARQTIAYLVDIPSVNNITTGIESQSANGLAAIFFIPHGLGGTPTYYMAQASSFDAKDISYIEVDGTNIIVYYTTSPLNGGSLIWTWAARL